MTDAARKIGSNVTTVSRRIQRLSDEMPDQIVTRTKDGWALTQHGSALVELAEEFDTRLADLNRSVASEGGAARRINLNTTDFLMSNCLVPFLDKFVASSDRVDLDISVSDKNISLAYGEADLVLRMSRPTEGRLIGKQIGAIKMGFFRNGASTSRDWIGLPPELDWTPEMVGATAFFGRPPKMRLPTFASLQAAAQVTGLGCVLPTFQVAAGSPLVRLNACSSSVIRELWIVFHETRRKDPSVRQVADWVESCVKDMHLSPLR